MKSVTVLLFTAALLVSGQVSAMPDYDSDYLSVRVHSLEKNLEVIKADMSKNRNYQSFEILQARLSVVNNQISLIKKYGNLPEQNFYELCSHEQFLEDNSEICSL